MLSQYNAWYNTTSPLDQMTDVTEAQVLAEQGAWATASAGTGISASETNGTVTVTNSGSAVNVPVTVPAGTTVNGAAFGQSYGGNLSDWVNLGTGATETLTENVAPAITSAASATSIVGAAFSFTVTTTGAPAPALTETGALPSGITFTDNGNGTATIAGTAAAGSGGSYPITITATNSVGQHDAELHADQRRGADHHQSQHRDLLHRGGGHLHGDHDRLTGCRPSPRPGRCPPGCRSRTTATAPPPSPARRPRRRAPTR